MIESMVQQRGHQQFAQKTMAIAVPLRASLERVLNEFSSEGSPGRRKLSGVHASIRSRLNRALQTENALASLYRMPGPDGLRQILGAAAREGAPQDSIDEAERLVGDYARFLVGEELTGESLRAILAGYLPEARDDLVRSSHRAVFRARSNLVGYFADTLVLMLFIYPGAKPHTCSVAGVRGYRDWRRLRADRGFVASGYAAREEGGSGDEKHTDLNCRPLASLNEAPIIEEICSEPLPTFDRVKVPHGYNFYLASDDIGAQSACNFFLGEILHDSEPRYRTLTSARAIQSVTISTPSKHLLFDVFVHQDVWPQSRPTLEVYNTTPLGPVNEDNYEWRANDRIEMDVSLRHMRPGLRSIETSRMPKYQDVVDRVLSRLQLNAASFRGYRCELLYPLYASQALIVFDLHEPPLSS